ncbi:hypothetical protein B296_00019385 [Ensete ventricosum]|uniref:Uncharacterized protein n=1 Tax=Ensete ventricosum TaxID=4639 RepID=A0A426ZJZ0_ENSVE|nr:hypothetical protein B296_00019385 [Ensete ventricosum]
MKSHPERCNKRRYCRFHREYRHVTKEHCDLQYQIEDLIRHGHLRRYISDQPSLPDSRPPRDSSPLPKGPIEKQIDIIFGGPTSGGDSSSARKAYARSEVKKRPVHDEDLDVTVKSGGEEYSCHDNVVHRGFRLSLGGDHDSCHVRRRTKVKDSYDVVHGGKALISVQRHH